MTIHPGESANQVSVFSILYATNFKEKFRLIETPEFITEKGIKLGISKSEIIDRLGTCYLAKDSSSNSILLEYKLELPNDSKTGFWHAIKCPSILQTTDSPTVIWKALSLDSKIHSIREGSAFIKDADN